jgi:DNA replication protein DnaC
MEVLRRYADSAVDNVLEGLGLLVWGDFGHGKTHASVGLLKKVMAYRATGLFLETSRIQRMVFDKEQMETTERPVLTVAENVDILVLDDFGAEHSSEFSQSLVAALVRYRCTRRKATILTTNIDPGKLAVAYSEGLMSVLSECVYPVRVGGKNWRAAEALKLRAKFEG